MEPHVWLNTGEFCVFSYSCQILIICRCYKYPNPKTEEGQSLDETSDYYLRYECRDWMSGVKWMWIGENDLYDANNYDEDVLDKHGGLIEPLCQTPDLQLDLHNYNQEALYIDCSLHHVQIDPETHTPILR